MIKKFETFEGLEKKMAQNNQSNHYIQIQVQKLADSIQNAVLENLFRNCR